MPTTELNVAPRYRSTWTRALIRQQLTDLLPMPRRTPRSSTRFSTIHRTPSEEIGCVRRRSVPRFFADSWKPAVEPLSRPHWDPLWPPLEQLWDSPGTALGAPVSERPDDHRRPAETGDHGASTVEVRPPGFDLRIQPLGSTFDLNVRLPGQPQPCPMRSSASRRAVRARNSRLLTVPMGMPSTSAISP